jgi:hypothetical protein
MCSFPVGMLVEKANVTNSTMSFMDKVNAKKRRVDNNKATTAYVDLKFNSPTSNAVERLFSLAKLFCSDCRKSMSPIVFEALLFLFVNQSYWNVVDVAKAMKCSSSMEVEDKEVSLMN